jgi:hypothetical protein
MGTPRMAGRLRPAEGLVFHEQLGRPVAGFEWVDAIPPDPLGEIGATRHRVGLTGVPYMEATTEKFDGRRGLERYLVPIESPQPGSSYHTEDHPTLFRSLAELEVAEQTIGAFAAKFGALATGHVVHLGRWSRKPHHGAESVRDGRGRPVLRYGNSLRLWRQEILGMKHALAVWDALQAGASAQSLLKGQFSLVRGRPYGDYAPNVAYDTKGEARLTHGCFAPNGDPDNDHAPHEGPYIFHSFFDSEDSLSLRTMGLAFLATVVGSRLELPLFLAPGFVARGKPAEPDGLRLQLRPTGVAGVAWLQLARAIEGNSRYVRCFRCHRWLAISPQAGRRAKRGDARYCSPTCRAAAGKQRREEALLLAARRVSPKKIAKLLGTSVEQVSKWIARPSPVPRS